MSIFQTTRARLLGLIAIIAVITVAGCAPHEADVQTPPGTKVGAPLTQAQVQAIQRKRGAAYGTANGN